MALPRDAMGSSAVCAVVFPDHTHILKLNREILSFSRETKSYKNVDFKYLSKISINSIH